MTHKTKYHASLMLLLTLVFLSLTAVTSSAQKANKLEIEHWREVLRSVERELKQTYYDPTFNGVDMSLGHDPVLAHAASLAGIALDSKKAGLLLTSR